ncbi:MAG: NTP transferase domain-containing protein [Deltaproteobacteria bacterium]|nr:NTP transferase domain-containing protein [Deltaproteobacteria bacterium]
MQAVILAGGLGTRLSQRTRQTPKFLLPVAGRPFGAWVIDRLRACGFTRALLCIGHLGEIIERAIGDGARFGLRVRYAADGPVLLGTGGALRQARSALAPSFLLTYGDSYLPFDYAAPLRDLDTHPEALGTLAVYRNEDRYDRSNVRVAGELVALYRKEPAGAPREAELSDIDYGAMALRREAVELIPAGRPVGLEGLQAELARSGRLRAWRATRRFYEIGSERGLGDLEQELARGAAAASAEEEKQP